MADATGTAPREPSIGIVVIHGVGETETGWINEHIVDPICSGGGAPLAATAHSELHSLPDGGRDAAGARFNTVVRRGRLGSGTGTGSVSVIELSWADLARVGRGPIAYIGSTLGLMFEAPDVLARAFLRDRMRGIHWLIGALILLCSRLLSWLVVGLNTTVIVCSLYMAMVWNIRAWYGLPPRYDSVTILTLLLPALLVLMAGGFGLHLWRRHRDIGLSEFGRGLGLSTALVLTYLGLDIAYGIESHLEQLIKGFKPQNYFDTARDIVFAVWVLWCVSMLAAIGLLMLVWLVRALGWRPRRRVPLAAAWVGIFNILIQAIVLKLIITPMTIVACSQLNGSAPPGQVYCSQDKSSGVLAFTFFEVFMLIMTLVGLLIVRHRAAGTARLETDTVPRLIVHPVMVAMAALTVTMHIFVFTDEIAKPLQLALMPGLGYGILHKELIALVTALVPVYLGLLALFHVSAGAIIHIARQLVDHQYRTASWRRRTASAGPEATAAFAKSRLPRRQHIAARLDAVMENLVAKEPLDRLIFLTHSQGTVIAFDYLRETEPSPALQRVGQVHVVTLGSPLSHLYACYFDEYQHPVAHSDLRGNVVSWHNLWRVDDPIGDRVGVVEGPLIQNWRLGPGGHVNYWKEPEVRSLLRDLIEGRVPQRASPPAPASAAG